MLGETPLPSKTRSVFEYLSQKDKERLQNIRLSLPIAASSSELTPTEPLPPPLPRDPGQINIPNVHPSIAKAALQGYQPFTSDPMKQSRYTAFLNYASQVSPSSEPSQIGIGPIPGQTVEEFNKELADYAKSAAVFKPLSGAMAGRFRSAAIIENGPKIIEGLHTPDHTSTPESEDANAKEEKKEEEPKAAAVRLGMYGPLTREIKPWQPARLLCKRFGVKDPEVELSTNDPPCQTDQGTEDVVASDMSKPALAITEGKGEDLDPHNRPRDLANIGLGEDETQGRDTLTYVRPSMDVFKAIFASDDEDSDDEEDGKENGQEGEQGELSESAPSAVDHIPAPLNEVVPGPSTSSPIGNGATTSSASEVVDIRTFKPTFVPRADRKTKDKKVKDKEKDKKKKSKSTLVSFGDEEEGALEVRVAAPSTEKHKNRDGERKKKKRKERKEDDNDDGMWVEKPPPEVVQSISQGPPHDIPLENEDLPTDKVAGPPRGRKRAIDFM